MERILCYLKQICFSFSEMTLYYLFHHFSLVEPNGLSSTLSFNRITFGKCSRFPSVLVSVCTRMSHCKCV